MPDPRRGVRPMTVGSHPALYTDAWSADPGQRVTVRATGAGRGRLDVVRLRGLKGTPLPDGYVGEAVGPGLEVTLAERDVAHGSCAWTADGPTVAAGSAWTWTLRILPTLADGGTVLDWGRPAIRIRIADGRLVVDGLGAGASLPVEARRWSEVRLARTAGGRFRLDVLPVGGDVWHRRARTVEGDSGLDGVAGPLRLGQGFNGRIEAPTLTVAGEPVAAWDFARAMTTQVVPGSGPQARPLTLVNAPRRAVTSSAWNGTCHDWTRRPDHYAAIHFHDDDLADCGWPATEEITLPSDLASGVYAVRLATEAGLHHAPLFVRARRPAGIAFLASTFSYLAYGNSIWASPSGPEQERRYPQQAAMARRYGLSTYSRHRDGSGIGLVSTRRPILNAVPGLFGEDIGGQVLLNDDLRIVSWLESLGETYDVITDHDLHERGAAALAGCRVLVTGAHPEYHSARSLDAVEAFVARGGRLMYMGGNGFYWRVDTLPDAPHVMELRRAETGIRIWAEDPGEYHHQSDGAPGGIWRRLGRPPNRLVGVGYTAQGGTDVSRPYRRTAAAADPRAAFLFEGVSGPLIGAEGPTGAAAGYELDRADTRLGTPPHALVVARSLPFDGQLSPVNEERLTHTLVDAVDPLRADMTFFEGPNGGAVFATGSIMFAGRLAEADGAGRVAANALRRFADPAPFALPTDATAVEPAP